MNTQHAVKERGRRFAGEDAPEHLPGARLVDPSGTSILQRSTARWQAAILLIAPATMLAGLMYHPHIGSPTDADFLANLGAAVSADTVRWAVAHLLVAVASGFIALAFLAIRTRLRAAGEDRLSGPGLPFIVMGSVMYALLPAMEFAPLAAAESGADPAAAQGALLPWFVPVLFTAGLTFLVGAVLFAMAIVRSKALSPRLATLVAGALIVMAVSRLVPLFPVQMHVQSAAGILALWPLTYVTWNDLWRRMK